jgi:peptide/nickel transport system permease protein
VNLGWLPTSGVANGIASFILPCIANSFAGIASQARHTRSSMLEVIRSDYIVTAKAKGLSEKTVLFKHALPNALIPIITIAGTQLGDIFTGSILVETIFSMNGVGSLMVNSINQRDLPLIEGGVMYIALICVVVYLVVDILYAVADPRIRLGGEAAE